MFHSQIGKLKYIIFLSVGFTARTENDGENALKSVKINAFL